MRILYATAVYGASPIALYLLIAAGFSAGGWRELIAIAVLCLLLVIGAPWVGQSWGVPGSDRLVTLTSTGLRSGRDTVEASKFLQSLAERVPNRALGGVARGVTRLITVAAPFNVDMRVMGGGPEAVDPAAQKRIRLRQRQIEDLQDVLFAFASLSAAFTLMLVLFWKQGWVTTTRPMDEGSVPGAAARYLGWHVLDAVPLLDVPGSVHWKEPKDFHDTSSGVILLVFKLAVILPIVKFVARYLKAA